MTRPINPLTAERLRELVNYDPETGIFTRLLCLSSCAKVGEICKNLRRDGYLQFTVDRKIYLSHRLSWLYVTGEWPVGVIDHINHIKDDNRFSNLRDVPILWNQQNQLRPQKNNTSGFLGVSKKRNQWEARITVNNKEFHLGARATPELAHELYMDTKRRVHAGFVDCQQENEIV